MNMTGRCFVFVIFRNICEMKSTVRSSNSSPIIQTSEWKPFLMYTVMSFMGNQEEGINVFFQHNYGVQEKIARVTTDQSTVDRVYVEVPPLQLIGVMSWKYPK